MKKSKINIQEVNYPTLYKKNNEGKIEQWSIRVWQNSTNKGYSVGVTFGEYRGKQQTKTYTVLKGKNVGKKNETTVAEQAWLEAEAKHNKKLKQGYVKNIKDAKAGKLDSIIEGGIIPMLAHSYDDHKEKIQFPVLAQPKLDGQRCIAHYKNGKVTLWTRSRKPILSCPHIVKKLEEKLKGHDELYLDGELYNHGLKNDFEKLMSAVRKQKPSEESLKVQYWLYDCLLPEDLLTTTEKRIKFIYEVFEISADCPVRLTPHRFLISHELLESYQQSWVEMGYEGLMVRNPKAEYEHKRSKHLLKMKTFQDAEFIIYKFQQGKDNTVIALCDNGKGQLFEATMSGDKEKNKRFLKGSWKGKKLTVKFQGMTGKNGVPRFPVGLRIRGEE